MPYGYQRMYINGKWVDAANHATIDVIDPARGSVIATVPRGMSHDIDQAVQAARQCFDTGAWPGLAPREREQMLLDLAQMIRQDRLRLAEMEVADCGKPLNDALADIDEAAFILSYYGGWITKIAGDIPPASPGAMSLVVKEPIGVAGLIVPWNYPFLMAIQKIAPALAAGCTCILKPAEQTPLTALALPRYLEAAHLPPGAVNIVTGYGEEAGEALVRHPDVDMISFTGSLEVGRHIQQAAAHTIKRVTLELGGKSPNIVFADADMDLAVAKTCFGVFWNQGEVCSAGSRVFVQESIYDAFITRVSAYLATIRVGSGDNSTTTMGPLISREHQERVLGYVQSAYQEGAQCIAKGSVPGDPALRQGFFVEPMVFTHVTPSMRIMQEEIFGPVMAVMPFATEDEVIALANDTPYGLAAAVWTRDIQRALSVAKKLRAGTVWINDSQPAPSEAPWGGYKQSGNGRELGRLGLEEYLETKHIYIRLDS
ncbi:MAG: aldehyde dehydrogenase family protein [Sulfobacillus thermotolerans]|nr:aldehyde dehydrogenase family protein [Sulfobacillus thermotolerans]